MNRYPRGRTALLVVALVIGTLSPALARGLDEVICESEGIICPGEEPVFDEPEAPFHPEEEILGKDGYEAAIEDEPGLYKDGEDPIGIPGGAGDPRASLLREEPDIWGQEDDDGWLD